MHSTRSILIGLFILVTSCLHAEYYVINDYHVQIKIYGSEGYFEVKETITLEFSEPRRGFIRTIPYRYRRDGKESELDIFDIDVKNFKFKTQFQSNNLSIKIGDKNVFVDGIQTYEITYKVKKGFLLFDDHTEFYWNVLGGDRKVDIKKIRYSIELDEAIPMTENDYAINTGMRGDTSKDATLSYLMGKFQGESTRTFVPGEGLTFAINLPVSYVRRPGKWEILFEKYGKAGIGGLFFLLISGLFYRTWSKYGKDYPIVRMVQYTPPKELNPAEAGVLIDEKADNVDILALIPYWAHNGHLTMKRIPKTWGKDDHELTKIKDLPANAGPYETIVFDGLFQGGNTVMVSDLENSFYEHLNAAKVSLKTHLNNMGVYYPVSIKMQIYSMIASVLLAFLAIFLGIVFESFALGVAIGLSSIIGFVFASYMLKKNQQGVHLYQQVLGFKMFVKAAEKERLEWLIKEDPDYFEKTLPYAMIFGYAKQWSKKFDGLLIEPPKWYTTPGGFYYGSAHAFSPSEFGSSFEDSIQDIQSAFTSVPASSGGSGGGFGGSGGGGFSGGGFGGGGDSSW